MQPPHTSIARLARWWGWLFVFAAAAHAQQHLPHPKIQSKTPPRTDRMRNDDGSYKLSFDFGGGPASGIGGTRKSQTFGGVVAASAGYNFNKYFSLQARAEYDRFGVPGPLLASLNQFGGNVQVFSATGNAIVRYYVGAHGRAYITGGGGYYRRVTRFTFPQTSGGQTIDQLTGVFYMNTFGGNGGLGFEWKPSFYNDLKIFTEARYHFINGTYANPSASGGFDLNNRNSQYIPLIIGVRF